MSETSCWTQRNVQYPSSMNIQNFSRMDASPPFAASDCASLAIDVSEATWKLLQLTQRVGVVPSKCGAGSKILDLQSLVGFDNVSDISFDENQDMSEAMKMAQAQATRLLEQMKAMAAEESSAHIPDNARRQLSLDDEGTSDPPQDKVPDSLKSVSVPTNVTQVDLSHYIHRDKVQRVLEETRQAARQEAEKEVQDQIQVAKAQVSLIFLFVLFKYWQLQ